MTSTSTPRGARVVVELDLEAEQALDRARRDARLSRPAFVRSTLAKALRDVGALSSAVREPAR